MLAGLSAFGSPARPSFFQMPEWSFQNESQLLISDALMTLIVFGTRAKCLQVAYKALEGMVHASSMLTHLLEPSSTSVFRNYWHFLILPNSLLPPVPVALSVWDALTVPLFCLLDLRVIIHFSQKPFPTSPLLPLLPLWG